MKKNIILLIITLLQIISLFGICLFRFSTAPFLFCVSFSVFLTIIFLYFSWRRAQSIAVFQNNIQSHANNVEIVQKEQSLLLPTSLEAEDVKRDEAACGAGQNDKIKQDIKENAKQEHKRTPTILVVDDNEINRAILTEILGQMGILTVEASDGQEAVDIICEWDISLVLMDLEMPVMDGREATAQIRGMGKLPQDVPILAMTAHTDDSLRMNCLALGMNGYLTKPIDVQELRTALQKWLPGWLLVTADEPEQFSSVSGKENEAQTPIDTDAGLAATGGNKKLYYNLLNRFVERYGHGMLLLREQLKKEAYVDASRLAHTIKGVAANLGMKRITNITKSIETCLPEISPDESLLVQFEEAMSEAIEYIHSLDIDTKTAMVGEKKIGEEDVAALLKHLEDLPHKVERDWGGMILALEKYSPITAYTPVAGEFVELLKAMDDFDLEEIERTAAKLQQRLSDIQ